MLTFVPCSWEDKRYFIANGSQFIQNALGVILLLE